MKIKGKETVLNASWLMAGRVMHMVLSFLIGLLTARYLGPNNYGLINYASAYTTFFTAFCTLGINSIIVKNFIDFPDEEGETIGTTLVIRVISSFFSVVVICGVVSFVDLNEPETLIVVALYSVSLIFQVFDTFNYWFQSKLRSKYYAIATIISFTIASVYRVVLLVFGKSVKWFAIANSIDYFIVAILLYYFYRRFFGPRLSFTLRKAKQLLSVSYNYILSGLMIAIYGATDKLMLKQMLDETAVGYYSLAVSISMMWTFILSSIIDSLKPTIMRYYNENKQLYARTNRMLYAIVFYISLIASIGISIIAPLFIKIVYGNQYMASVEPLRIVVWYVTFAYLGVARDTWVVCEKKQEYLKFLYIGSAVINVVLNFLLIPIWGANGAAVATVITQISTIFFFPLLIREFRPNVKIIVEAIMLKGIIERKHQGDKPVASNQSIIVTAGSNYLDIDAYACCIAMQELLTLKGEKVIAYSPAPYNYSICDFLVEEERLVTALPAEFQRENVGYMIVDVSDPDYIQNTAILDRVVAVYDHHVGFEEYWTSRIGENSHIEFIGAAATLIYREWQKAGLQDKMSRSTALLLIAAILDNTLNLTSPITTSEDIDVFEVLCKKENIDADWCASYFSKVQEAVEKDLQNALLHDLKRVSNPKVLPSRVAQLCVWNGDNLFRRLPEIRQWLAGTDSWLLNVIDIHQNCSYFVCDDDEYQRKIEIIFDVCFKEGIAKTTVPYLRKEIIKKCIENGG